MHFLPFKQRIIHISFMWRTNYSPLSKMYVLIEKRKAKVISDPCDLTTESGSAAISIDLRARGAAGSECSALPLLLSQRRWQAGNDRWRQAHRAERRRKGSGNVLVVRATEGWRGAAHCAAEAAATATAAATARAAAATDGAAKRRR